MKFRLPKLPLPQRRLKVKEATAVRAIFVAGGEEMHVLSLTFRLDPETTIDLELSLPEAGKFITQMKAAYNAALPTHSSNIH